MRLITLVSLFFVLLTHAPVNGQEQNDDLVARAVAGDLHAVQQALANGADVNTVSRNRASLLLAAAISNHVELSEFLLSEGADPNLANAEGTTPLYAASMVGHARIVELLLKLEADPDVALDGIYSTPLMIAMTNNRAAIVRILLDAGADPKIKNPDGLSVVDMVHPELQPEIASLLHRPKE